MMQLKRSCIVRNEMIKGLLQKRIWFVHHEVQMKNNNPGVVSRVDESFLAKLLEQEVPEIEDGFITIKNIAKVAVESYDDRIDPGACRYEVSKNSYRS